MQPTQQEIDSFVAPVPQVGETVLWYGDGAKSKRFATAVVCRVFGRLVDLVVTDGRGPRIVNGTRHLDDPKLKLNAAQREAGAWEFTPHSIIEKRKWESLLDRVRILELCTITEVTHGERAVLLRLCKEMGLKGAQKMKNTDLKQYVLEGMRDVLEKLNLDTVSVQEDGADIDVSEPQQEPEPELV